MTKTITKKIYFLVFLILKFLDFIFKKKFSYVFKDLVNENSYETIKIQNKKVFFLYPIVLQNTVLLIFLIKNRIH